jgi:hypothetical protein
MMKGAVVFACLLSAALAGDVAQVRPPVPGAYEFYWDDGVVARGWVWYTGGNYWGVQYDEVKTEGRTGWVEAFLIESASGFPYTGCYFHVLDDRSGYPGVSLCRVFYDNYGYWTELDPEVHVSVDVFYGAMEQIGNGYNADQIGVDIAAGTHNWTGYRGLWGLTTLFGDFIIRVRWRPEEPSVTETSWGRVKSLY